MPGYPAISTGAGHAWLPGCPGALAASTVAASAGFGAICGSCAATCATMGTIALPEMRKYGYSDQLSTGSIAFGGTLGILIPPSTPMIIYCIMAEESIGKAVHRRAFCPGSCWPSSASLTIVHPG